jgi:hypothetical protein
MFGGETNVSVGQFNQSSIEILFAVCRGRIGAAPSRSSPRLFVLRTVFLPKKLRKASR